MLTELLLLILNTSWDPHPHPHPHPLPSSGMNTHHVLYLDSVSLSCITFLPDVQICLHHSQIGFFLPSPKRRLLFMSSPLLIFTFCKSASKHLVLIIAWSQQSVTDYDVLLTKLPVTWLDPHDKAYFHLHDTKCISLPFYSSIHWDVGYILSVFTSGFQVVFVLKSECGPELK